jgi:DNA-directed RNA polymerase subunit RPC12/RpoP
MPLPDQKCPHCGVRVFREHRVQDAYSLEVIHEPDSCHARPVQDAPGIVPGTADGRNRFG